MSEPVTLYYPENGQRIVLYPNGFGISRICNMFSYGVEIVVLEWKRRDPTKWERLRDRIKSLVSKPLNKPFYYEAEFLEGNILNLPSFFGKDQESTAQYVHLKPEEEKQVMAKVKELKKSDG